MNAAGEGSRRGRAACQDGGGSGGVTALTRVGGGPSALHFGVDKERRAGRADAAPPERRGRVARCSR